MDQQSNDDISISDLLIVLIKHRRLWIISFIILFVIATTLAFINTDKYEYKTNIIPPQYLQNGQLQPIIAIKAFNTLLDNYYTHYRNAHPNNPTITALKLNDNNILTIKSPNNANEIVTQTVEEFLNYISKQPNYLALINNWKKNIQFNLLKTEQLNKIYENNIKKLQNSVDALTKSKDISSVNTQALLSNLSNAIISYQQ